MDCAIVSDSIRGEDPDDLSPRDVLLGDPFLIDITNLTVGYLDDVGMEVVHVLASKGVNVVPFKLNYTVDSVQGITSFTMDFDMLAHFDEWQRSGQDDEYETQDYNGTKSGGKALALAMAYQLVTNHHSEGGCLRSSSSGSTTAPIDELGPNDSIPNPPRVIHPPRLLRL
ncbi:hypothetical protein L484_011602 [Morus notabilis]|uniref:Uncharacterized protein n=1 Tax=Morus notabilis TaxID=981085 RepID=W9RIG8_9ROSA|nr:hypothetical protein L484_011602 [Morus notabilis]